MKLFHCDYTGNNIRPFLNVETDGLGDFIRLGMTKDQLKKVINNKSLFDSLNSTLNQLEEKGLPFIDNIYFSDLCPPEISQGNRLYQAFPYRDEFWDEDDDEIVQNWEMQDPKGHSYGRLYLKHNPRVLIGIVETIHYNTPQLFDDLARCRLVGISFLKLFSNGLFDEGNYFITRHLVVLHPGDAVRFSTSFWRNKEKAFYTGIVLNYNHILESLKSFQEG